jgi:ArsR family transcriptional regulator
MATELQKMETLFQALGDATRLRILGLLTTGEVCVCDIHDTLKIPQPKASRHLAYLRRAGLVTARRDGLWMHYSLAPSADPLVAAIRQAVDHTLGHVASVRRDAERLSTRTGCCVPALGASPGLPCCAPARSDPEARS